MVAGETSPPHSHLYLIVCVRAVCACGDVSLRCGSGERRLVGEEARSPHRLVGPQYLGDSQTQTHQDGRYRGSAGGAMGSVVTGHGCPLDTTWCVCTGRFTKGWITEMGVSHRLARGPAPSENSKSCAYALALKRSGVFEYQVETDYRGPRAMQRGPQARGGGERRHRTGRGTAGESKD